MSTLNLQALLPQPSEQLSGAHLCLHRMAALPKDRKCAACSKRPDMAGACAPAQQAQHARQRLEEAPQQLLPRLPWRLAQLPSTRHQGVHSAAGCKLLHARSPLGSCGSL